MIQLSDPDILKMHPARLYNAKGRSRSYVEGAPSEFLINFGTDNCYDKFLICTHIRKTHFKGNPMFNRRLCQPFLSIEYIYEGRMLVKSNDQAYIAEPGDICLLHPNQDQEFMVDPDYECLKIGMIFQGSLLESLLEQMKLADKNTVFFPDFQRFDFFFDRFCDAFAAPKSSSSHDVISGLCFELLQAIATAAATAESSIPVEIIAIADEIKGAIGTNITMDVLASKHGMTLQTLNSKFKTYLKTTAYQYLIRQRMSAAAQYLKENHLSVKEVASLVGYESQLNFSTAFRNYYGCSPSEYGLNK